MKVFFLIFSIARRFFLIIGKITRLLYLLLASSQKYRMMIKKILVHSQNWLNLLGVITTFSHIFQCFVFGLIFKNIENFLIITLRSFCSFFFFFPTVNLNDFSMFLGKEKLQILYITKM
jgi:hypothetical protein